MRLFLILLTLLFVSCHSPSEQEKLRRSLPGNWVVLLADHKLENSDQRLVYGRIQDSVIEAKALKLITFFEDGSFMQADYPDQKGKWALSTSGQLYIGLGGKGFEEFKTDFKEYKDKVLQVIELLHVKGESIKLVWHFKKVNESFLFDAENNTWRKRATKSESEEEIRRRLSAMFGYYSAYFKLVAAEVSYFIGRRVILPLKFYQHAMGTLPFDEESNFAKLFYNREQAEQAYDYVKRTVYNLGNKYPEGENFVDEYATFLKMVGKEIGKEKGVSN
jgi:hypothetical protein